MKEDEGWRSFALRIAACGIHAMLAVVYAGETPYRTAGRLRSYAANVPDIGAPDERQHANYVQHLLDGNGFPVFKPMLRIPASITRIISLLSFIWRKRALPNWSVFPTSTRQTLTSSDGLTPSSALERFGCFLSRALGTWQARNRSWGRRHHGDASYELRPERRISNDPLLFMICTWTLAVCANALRQGWNLRWQSPQAPLWARNPHEDHGRCAPAYPPSGCRAPAEATSDLGMFAVAAVILAILAVPWLVRNQQEYGDPLALKVFNSAFGGSRKRRTP